MTLSNVKRQCESCFEWFTPSRKNHRFCNALCSNRWHQEQHRVRRGELLHEPEQRECENCGNVYWTRRVDQRLCGAECRQAEKERQDLQRQGEALAVAEGVHAITGDPKEAYEGMKALAQAAKRDWDLSYAEWWRLWAPFWHNRGAYRMYRLDTTKGYVHKNVVVMTPEVASVYYEEPYRLEDVV